MKIHDAIQLDPSESPEQHNTRWRTRLRRDIDRVLIDTTVKGHKVMTVRITGETIEAGKEDEYPQRQAEKEEKERTQRLRDKEQQLADLAEMSRLTAMLGKKAGFQDVYDEGVAMERLCLAARHLICIGEGGNDVLVQNDGGRRLLAQVLDILAPPTITPCCCCAGEEDQGSC